jgi:hypothetical protein
MRICRWRSGEVEGAKRKEVKFIVKATLFSSFIINRASPDLPLAFNKNKGS